jgi:protein TonB
VFKRIHQFITNKAVYPQSALNDGTQGVVFIRFVKAKDGKVSKIQIKGEDERLNKEARRVIASLPKMEGVQDGKSIRYNIRIKFKIGLNKQPIVGLYIYV